MLTSQIMEFIKTPGIILKSIDYKERKKIITVFTQNHGLISLIAKNSHNLPTLSLAFLIYKKSLSDIFSLHDLTIENQFLFLREDLEFIKSAYSMTKAILDSQMPQKSSKRLFALLLSYLQKIPAFTHQDTLISSFYLKILLHEGLFFLKKKCSCGKNAQVISKGETLCLKHKKSFCYFFSTEEIDLLCTLTYAKTFSNIQKINLPKNLIQNIQLIFKDLI